jgi:wyosine [tRNA(Phe)-imidazoG37] synthetase (radical SAM superfamily)
MLVAGVNDMPESVAAVARFLSGLGAAAAYLSVPTRPPAHPGVRAPDAAVLNEAYQAMAGVLQRVELLVGYEGDAVAATGDFESDLLATCAVHPLRRSAVVGMLARCGETWDAMRSLLARGLVEEVEHVGEVYYLRRHRRSEEPGLEGGERPGGGPGTTERS